LSRNCLPKRDTEGKIEGKIEDVGGGRKREQLLNDIKGKILDAERGSTVPLCAGHSVEEAMDLSQGRTKLGDVAGHHFTSSATVSFSKRNLI
jgi:hypothetical protein